jgi:hypothetical protein
MFRIVRAARTYVTICVDDALMEENVVGGNEVVDERLMWHIVSGSRFPSKPLDAPIAVCENVS